MFLRREGASEREKEIKIERKRENFNLRRDIDFAIHVKTRDVGSDFMSTEYRDIRGSVD